MCIRDSEKDRPHGGRSLTRSVIPLSTACWLPACGVVGAGAALSAGRHTHRRERGQFVTPDFTPTGLPVASPIRLGDADSTRRTGLLDRACRCHRQLLSNRGNRRVLRLPLAWTSIFLGLISVNPTRTGHSRTSWWNPRRHENVISGRVRHGRVTVRRDLVAAAGALSSVCTWHSRTPRTTRRRS